MNMRKTKPWRVGMIGFGVMAKNLADRIQERPDFELAAVWDPSVETKGALSLYSGVEMANNAELLCARADIDLVYIASPPVHHVMQAGMAFDYGKAVLCEKPLGIDSRASKVLVDRVAQTNLKGAVNFGFATAPAINDIAQRLKNGDIGSLMHVEIEAWFKTWPRGWQHAGKWLSERIEGGFTREVISHFIFALRRFLGPLVIHNVHVDYPNDGISSETSLTAQLSAGGIPVRLHAGIGGEEEDNNSLIFHGENGILRLHHWYQGELIQNETVIPLLASSIEKERIRARHVMMDGLSSMLAGEAHELARFDEAYDVQVCVEKLLNAS